MSLTPLLEHILLAIIDPQAAYNEPKMNGFGYHPFCFSKELSNESL